MSRMKNPDYHIEFVYEREEWEDYNTGQLQRLPYEVTAIVKSGDKTLHGKATCHESDNFVKEVGRKLALSRAIKDLDQPIRKAIWEVYFNRSKLT